VNNTKQPLHYPKKVRPATAARYVAVVAVEVIGVVVLVLLEVIKQQAIKKVVVEGEHLLHVIEVAVVVVNQNLLQDHQNHQDHHQHQV
jgi:hypothetical protein